VGGLVVTLAAPLLLPLFWSGGALVGGRVVFQSLGGILLATFFSTKERFVNIEVLVRDVFFGARFRFYHSSLASFIFMRMYFHIYRSFYFRLKNLTVWRSGRVLLIFLITISFLGYVLPWGQMSFWGASVIINFLSVLPFVGEFIVFWVWGGYLVGMATLKFFFVLHFFFAFFNNSYGCVTSRFITYFWFLC